MIKFRTRNNRVPVDTGCWYGIDLNMRKCSLCNVDDSIGDEYHVLLECPVLAEKRKLCIKQKFYKHHNVLTFEQLMNLPPGRSATYRKLCMFVRDRLRLFNS